MRRRSPLVGAALCAALVLAACGSDSGSPDDQNVINVPGDAPTIQAAVDMAVPGDLILVEEGVYAESVTVDVDDIVIRGVDRNKVILDGEGRFGNGIRVAGANGVAIEPSAWTPVSAASGRVARGAVWDDIEVAIFDPDMPLGQMSGPFRWEKDGSDPRWTAHARHFEGAEDVPGIVRVRLARLAVFPLEGHGYAGTALAWAYAPGAPDTFFKGRRFTFHRYSGDWFVSRGWIMSLEDEPSGRSPSP